jgi:chromosome segregation ATPase
MSVLKKALCIFLLAACLSPSPSAFAANYTMTAAELTELQEELKQQDMLLNEAENSNQKSQMELAALRSELQASKTELLQLTALLKELQQKSQDNEMRWRNAAQALDAANKSLLEYKKEVQEKQSHLKTQRNIAYLLCTGAVYFAVKK